MALGGIFSDRGRIRSQIMKESQGTKVYAISATRLGNVEVAFPADEKEQQKIADCLTSLDELIAAQGRKVEALKAHKKGLMQQLFPREGETLPRLRFPEFRDKPAWDSRSLGLVCDLKAGEFVSASAISDEQKNDLFPCYGGNGLRGYVASFTHEGALCACMGDKELCAGT